MSTERQARSGQRNLGGERGPRAALRCQPCAGSGVASGAREDLRSLRRLAQKGPSSKRVSFNFACKKSFAHILYEPHCPHRARPCAFGEGEGRDFQQEPSLLERDEEERRRQQRWGTGAQGPGRGQRGSFTLSPAVAAPAISSRRDRILLPAQAMRAADQSPVSVSASQDRTELALPGEGAVSSHRTRWC